MRRVWPVLAAVNLVALLVAAPVAASMMPTGESATVAATAAAGPKVVIIVGATEGVTSTYRAYADAEYAEAIKYTSNVIKVYSPNATWAAVKAAVEGASIVIYHGHGNGWPSPYTYDPNYTTKNGFGLNATAGNGDYNNTYYGEPYIRTLNLAPNAVILLHNLCYASGNSEPGYSAPSLDVAKQRVDNYASAFLAAGAKAVIADGHSSAVGYLRRLFTVDETLISTWRNHSSYHGNEFSFASSRTPGATAYMDPDQPGSGFYRAITGYPAAIRSTDVTGLASATYSPTCDGANIRTQPSTSATIKTQLSTSAIVTVTGIVSGTSWTTNCLKDCPTIRAGSSWYVISTINGQSVSSLYGVNALYAATGVLRPTSLAAPASPTGGTPTATVAPPGATYVSVTPNRVLDSRVANGFSGPLQAGVARAFQVTDRNPADGAINVPANAVAITGNLTVTNATAGGWLSLTPTLDNNPATSTLNFPVGDSRASGVTVPLGAGGSLSVAFNGPAGGNTTDVVFDVTGYFLPGSTGAVYIAVSPNRLLDSRFMNGFYGPIGVGAACGFQVADRNSGNAALNVPVGAIAVTGSLTVTAQTAAGWFSLTPTLDNNPATSTLNFPRGDDRANGVTLLLGGGGILSVAFNGAPAGNIGHAIFDVTGYFVTQ